jgi:hypothetical protein
MDNIYRKENVQTMFYLPSCALQHGHDKIVMIHTEQFSAHQTAVPPNSY